MVDKILEAQINNKILKEAIILPDRGQREDSDIFKKSKEQLKKDGHWHCFVPGCDHVDLESHHFLAEYSYNNLVDFNKLKLLTEKWDSYGYGKSMSDHPITSVDDIRNQLVLCAKHHRMMDQVSKNGVGIHTITFSIWVSQLVCKDNCCPVPQENETSQDVLNRIEKYTDLNNI